MTLDKNQNALKHGAFAKAIILPSEDPKEFEVLYQSLIDEWNPEGPSEQDRILSVARNMWLKRRMTRYFQKSIAELTEQESSRQRRETRRFDNLMNVLDVLESSMPGSITEQDLPNRISPRWADHLKKNYPRKNYESDSAWISVITNAICALADELLSAPASEVEDEFSDEAFSLRQLEIDGAIDAKIERDLKQLGQIKTMKAMGIGKRCAAVTLDSTKQIELHSKLQKDGSAT